MREKSTAPAIESRAARWQAELERLGLRVPTYAIEDFGLLLSVSRVQAAPARAGTFVIDHSDRYTALLLEWHAEGLFERFVALRLGDELIAAVIAKVLGLVGGTSDFITTLGDNRERVAAALLAIDLDLLRLFGLSYTAGGQRLATAPHVDVLDVLASLSSAVASDVAHLSLELLPSIGADAKRSGAQLFALDGYSTLTRHGTLDHLLTSELAWDDDMFLQKAIDQELYYYGFDRSEEKIERVQLVLVDASASMSGRRQVFARAVAWAIAARESRKGEDVRVQFFDSHLYELRRVTDMQRALPYLLAFKAERGRNYRRAFEELIRQVRTLKERQARARVTVYVITHAECHVADGLVAELARVAELKMIFLLPSGGQLPSCARLVPDHLVVDDELLARADTQRDTAAAVVRQTLPQRVRT